MGGNGIEKDIPAHLYFERASCRIVTFSEKSHTTMKHQKLVRKLTDKI